MVEDWQGCKAKKCPYDKEHGNCEYCQYLVRKCDKSKEVETNDNRTKTFKS